MRTTAQAIEDLNWSHDHRNCRRASAPVLYLSTEDGSTVEIALPTRWAVCPVCQGAGTHVNPSIDCGGLSAEDFDEDPDFAEDYMAGAYDVPCNRCGGRTTVPEVDVSRLSPELADAYERQCRDEAADRACELAEMRMGA